MLQLKRTLAINTLIYYVFSFVYVVAKLQSIAKIKIKYLMKIHKLFLINFEILSIVKFQRNNFRVTTVTPVRPPTGNKY